DGGRRGPDVVEAVDGGNSDGIRRLVREACDRMVAGRLADRRDPIGASTDEVVRGDVRDATDSVSTTVAGAQDGGAPGALLGLTGGRCEEDVVADRVRVGV